MNGSEDDLRVLTSVPHDFQAALIVNALQEQGIRGAVSGTYTAGFRAEAPGWVQVLVREADLPAAAAVFETVERASFDDQPDPESPSDGQCPEAM